MDQAEMLIKIMKNQKEKTSQDKKKGPRIISVASGKGGVGKTNIAINLGIVLSKFGKEVIVMDADLGLANVNVILGVIPKYNLYSVIKGQKRIKDIIIDSPEGIKIIAGASGFSQLANLEEEKMNYFIRGLNELDYADVVIVDTSAGISSNVLGFLLSADEIVIVTTPEPTSITDAYGIIKSIAAKTNNALIKLIVNRVQSIDEADKVAKRVVNIAKQFLNVKVINLGYIFEDNSVQKSVISQKPFYSLDPKSKASVCLEDIAYKLENLDVPERKEGFANFFKNFLRFAKTN